MVLFCLIQNKGGGIMFEKLLKTESSWEFFKNTSLPIAIYGTGNGADRVFEEFKSLSEQSYPKPAFRSLEISPDAIAPSTAALPPVPIPSAKTKTNFPRPS